MDLFNPFDMGVPSHKPLEVCASMVSFRIGGVDGRRMVDRIRVGIFAESQDWGRDRYPNHLFPDIRGSVCGIRMAEGMVGT